MCQLDDPVGELLETCPRVHKPTISDAGTGRVCDPPVMVLRAPVNADKQSIVFFHRARPFVCGGPHTPYLPCTGARGADFPMVLWAWSPTETHVQPWRSAAQGPKGVLGEVPTVTSLYRSRARQYAKLVISSPSLDGAPVHLSVHRRCPSEKKTVQGTQRGSQRTLRRAQLFHATSAGARTRCTSPAELTCGAPSSASDRMRQ